MTLTVLSSLYFIVLMNQLAIGKRECARIGGPFPSAYTGTYPCPSACGVTSASEPPPPPCGH